MLFDRRELYEAVGELCTSDSDVPTFVIVKSGNQDETMGKANTRDAYFTLSCFYADLPHANKGTVLSVEGVLYVVEDTKVENFSKYIRARLKVR